jgi:hypothetical protein
MNTPTPPAADPLAQLRDIHLPAPVAWWPPAPGWWLLAGATLLLIGTVGYFLLRRYKRRRYRRLAQRAANTIYAQWQQQGDNLAFVQALNQLLKQTALVAFPGAPIAALSGTAWLQFLDSRLATPQFNRAETRVLADVYQTRIEHLQADAIQRAAEHWLRRHKC